MKYTLEQLELSLHLMEILSHMVGQDVESHVDMQDKIRFFTENNLKLVLDDVNTESDCGPIYKYVGEIEGLEIITCVGDFSGDHKIAMIKVGPNATYINENMKNILKSSVN